MLTASYISPKWLAIIILQFACSWTAGAEQWQKFRSGRWELWTDGDSRAGAALLAQLVETEGVFSRLAFPLKDSAPPVRVFLFRSEKEFMPFRQAGTTKGFFQPGPERDYILLFSGLPETARAARHEAVHLVLHHSVGPLPQWVEEGLGDYYSTLELRNGKIVTGQEIAIHAVKLRNEPALALEALFSAGHDSELFNDADTVELFYSSSWALVHMMARQAHYRGRLNRFLESLTAGMSQPAALEIAFGRTLEDVRKDLAQYIAAGRFSIEEIPINIASTPAVKGPDPTGEAEAELALADLALAVGKTALAEDRYKRAAARWSTDPEAIAGLGYLAMHKSDYETARRQLGRAAELGSRQASTYFEYAVLLRDTGAPASRIIENLRKAVQINPAFAEAWYLLGWTYLSAGEPARAAEHIERAVEILPRQSPIWESLGRAYLGSGNRDSARKAALKALLSASNEAQHEMARGLLKEIETQPAVRSEKKPPLQTPAGWQAREPDATAEGRLVMIDCSARILKFHIETQPARGRLNAVKIILTAERPNEIQITGAGGERKEFLCGVQTPALQVEAGYLLKLDPKASTAGDLVRLAFK